MANFGVQWWLGKLQAEIIGYQAKPEHPPSWDILDQLALVDSHNCVK